MSNTANISDTDEGLENPDVLPDYTERLAMFHAEFQKELFQVIAGLPLPETGSFLDVGCGDGFYSGLLAQHRPSAAVLGVDGNRAMLQRARNAHGSSQVSFRELAFESLGELHTTFDLVWCAQSLFSFVDEKAALRAMEACVKPGGILAVLENDYLHQLLLPWPADMELTVRSAELQMLRRETSKPNRYYVGRRLPQLLANAGLVDVRFRTQAIDRAAPLSAALREFLDGYLTELGEHCQPFLEPTEQRRARGLLDPASPLYLPAQSQFTMTWLNNFACGRKPAEKR